MFTGIIEAIGTVKTVEKKGTSGRITVETALDLGGVAVGDSIAVSGACLTVVALKGNTFSADVSDETLKLTTLGSAGPGERVNLELALTLSKPLGGHIVTGHVDCVGTVERKAEKGENLDIEVSVPREFLPQLVRKGSVAMDGISLTVAVLTDKGFRTVIIPHTIENTTLSEKRAGTKVNIETDIIGKYVERVLKGGGGGGKNITEGFLKEHGFIG
ncbi:MAG: riboflavin synthase [Thermodesulfobacteriota bacterium]